jgi:hypothetical protein
VLTFAPALLFQIFKLALSGAEGLPAGRLTILVRLARFDA